MVKVMFFVRLATGGSPNAKLIRSTVAKTFDLNCCRMLLVGLYAETVRTFFPGCLYLIKTETSSAYVACSNPPLDG